MDPDLIKVENIPQEVRLKLLRYVIEVKGVKPSDLGYDKTYIYRVKHGKVPVSDELLRKLLKFITIDEYVKIVGKAPEIEDATPSDAIRVIKKMKVDEKFRDFVFNLLRQTFNEYLTFTGTTYIVSEKDLQEFEKSLIIEGKSKKTIKMHLNYLKRALIELNFTLSPENLKELIANVLQENGENVARHIVKAIKKFIKTVVIPKNLYLGQVLYHSIKTIKSKPNNKVKPLSIDEVRTIFKALPTIESKVYFLLLAECGLRPGEPFLIKVQDVDFERRYIRICKLGETKREFITFIHEETCKFIKEKYIPIREKFVRQVEPGIKASGFFSSEVVENWKQKFIPFDQNRLRREIKETSKRVIGREIELYELRKFFTTYMIMQGVPETIVNTLTGKAPPSEFRVLIEHYWTPKHEELRKWYEKYAPKICC